MKKCLMVFFLVMAALLPGCEKTTARGRVVDQNGEGLTEIRLVIGDRTVTTSTDGAFTLSSIAAGTYQVQGRGGAESLYIVSPKQVTIVAGQDNDLGAFIAYRLSGIGVVAQSLSTAESLALKAHGLPSFRRAVHPWLHPARVISRAATAEFLTNNVSFFQLAWQPLIQTWITRYEVHYLGPDGSVDELVWRSDMPQSEDPVFDQGNPRAYLDLGNELAGKVVSPGSYRFRIMAKGGSQSVELPDITVSIGMVLSEFPSGLSFSGEQLSWTGIQNAASYRVSVYDEAQSSLLYASLLLTETSIQVPEGLQEGAYHRWWVDAFAVDSEGWTCEMTRAISGFIR